MAAALRVPVDAGTALVGNAVAVGVVFRFASILAGWTDRPRALPPIRRLFVFAQFTDLAASSARPVSVQAGVLVAASWHAVRRTTTSVVDGVVGVTVAIVVFRRRAIARSRADLALARAPLLVLAGLRSGLAQTDCRMTAVLNVTIHARTAFVGFAVA